LIDEPALVLSDAGPLMALGKLNRLDLLARLYSAVTIPRAVYEEVVVEGLARGLADARTVQLFWRQWDWPVVEVDPKTARAFVPSKDLGRGEHHVLALALESHPRLVLLDEELARAEARRQGLPVKGTLGVLVDCFRDSLLTLEELELLFEQIVARTDIWISERLCQAVLERLRSA
jgi:predicted nucleic acid-binding protein